MAFRSDDKVQCLLLPKEVKNIHTSVALSVINVCQSIRGTETKVALKIPFLDTVTYWTVISSFNILITGDLSFFATSTGHDGHSHCRCVYCDSTQSEWSEVDHPPGNIITLLMLHNYALKHSQNHNQNTKVNIKGVVMITQLNVEPSTYIIPLLHLLIGMEHRKKMHHVSLKSIC